jgi:hypothetical protein
MPQSEDHGAPSDTFEATALLRNNPMFSRQQTVYQPYPDY